MTSTIFSDHDTWHVTNMMFWRVLDMANKVGAEVAKDATELEWVERLRQFDERSAKTYSPDIDVRELFRTSVEAAFWAEVMFRLANKIYERTFGNQDNQTWQTPTIWAAYDLGIFLKAASKQTSWKSQDHEGTSG